MNKKLLFYGIVAIQVVFLLGMVLFKQMTLWYGVAVLLKPVPVDPTDFIRGDFVNLRYEISTLSSSLASKEFNRGQTAYVSLENKGEYWDAKAMSDYKSVDPYLKGIVDNKFTKESYTITEDKTGKNYQYDMNIYGGEYQPGYLSIGDKVQFSKEQGGRLMWVNKCPDCVADQYQSTGVVTNMRPLGTQYSVTYPIQSYFIPKESGDAPELMNVSDMLVEAKIWNGDAIVTRLLFRGEEIKFK